MILRNEDGAIKVNGSITNIFSYTYRIKFEGTIIEANANSFLINLLGEYELEAGSIIGKVYINRQKGEKLIGQVNRELTTKMVKMDELNISLVNLVEIGSGIIQEGNLSYLGLSFYIEQGGLLN